MKLIRRIVIIITVIAVLLLCVFLVGRYGWKMFGFRFCDGAGIETVEVGHDTVTIRGFYPGSFPQGFCGYYAEEENGILSVGVRYSGIFGYFETGDFEISIPTSSSIEKVILKTDSESRVIYDSADAE